MNLFRGLLNDAFKVRALVRDESSAESLKNLTIDIFKGSSVGKGILSKAMKDCKIVIHAASITSQKSYDYEYFKKINVDAT